MGLLNALTYLEAEGNSLSSPSLEGFPQLRNLRLDRTGISDLAPLVSTLIGPLEYLGLMTTRSLTFRRSTVCRISAGIEAQNNNVRILSLRDLPKLNNVRIQRSGIQQVDLENTPELFEFDLGGNNLADISSLADFMAAQLNPNGGILIFRFMKTGLKISVRWPKSSDWVMYLFKTTALETLRRSRRKQKYGTSTCSEMILASWRTRSMPIRSEPTSIWMGIPCCAQRFPT